MFCSNCGKPLSSNDKFCKSCGFPNQNNNLENNSNNNQNNFNMNQNAKVTNNSNFNINPNGLNNNPSEFNMNQNKEMINNQNGFNMNQNNQMINNQNGFNINQNKEMINNQNDMINQENNRYESTNNMSNINNNETNNSNNLLNRILHGKNRNLYIVIGILSIISLICITLVIVNAFNKLKDNKEQISTQTETINLGGTTYQIPSGYKINESGSNYYILQDSKFLFKISLVTGDYNTYKANLNTAFSEIVKMYEAQGGEYIGVDIPTIGGREYIILQFSFEGKILTFYVTNSNYANYVYCGSTSNKLFTYNSNDFLDISTMLLNPNSSSFDSSKVGDMELDIDLDQDFLKDND